MLASRGEGALAFTTHWTVAIRQKKPLIRKKHTHTHMDCAIEDNGPIVLVIDE